MTAQSFVLTLAVGGALIALWLDARFPKFAPQTFRNALIHIAAALVGAQLIVWAGLMRPVDDSTVALLAGAIGVALPVLVYQFLAAVWVIKLTQAVFRSYR